MDEDYRINTQSNQELDALRRSVARYSESDIQNKKLLEKYWKNMEQFRLIAESAGDAIWTVDMRMRPTYISPSFSQMLGYTVEEAFSLKMEDIFTSNAYKDALTTLQQEMNKGLLRNQDLRPLRDMNLEMLHKDGSVIPVEIRYSILRKPGEKDVELLAIARNVDGRKQQYEKLQGDAGRLVSILESTVSAIAIVGEIKDPYTAGHQRRVANIASEIARELALPQDRIRGLCLTALVHDIGKVRIPGEILVKAERLSDMEWELIKLHPTTGFTILKTIQSPWPIAETVFQHHERINGSGYPRKLTRSNILLEAKILSVADVFEAMLAHRPYRPALSMEIVVQELKQNRGILYDADIVDACLKLAEKDATFLDRVKTESSNLLRDFSNH